MGKIVKVSGPLVVATGMEEANMADVVRVGEQRLIGEILNMSGGAASIQVYEETSGLGPGAEVVTTGAPMSVELGPGMIEGIYDGIQRPLEKIVEKVGASITRGVEVPAVDHEKKWEFTATAKVGERLRGLELEVVRFGDGGGYYVHTMKDMFDNVYTWMTSSRALEQGTWVRMDATVKKHEEYKGVKQTHLTRPAIKEVKA
mgnify:CR=1 FL=1